MNNILRAAERVRGVIEPAEANPLAEFVAGEKRRLVKAQVGLDPFSEVGTTGLRQFGGYVLEEWLTQLAGRKAAWVYREMLDNDPTVGAVMFAIRWLARSVEWRVEEGNDARASELVETCMHDMSTSWGDTISDILSFLPYGWSFHEVVYKRRNGDIPPAPFIDGAADDGSALQEDDSHPATSRYKDGLIGWRKLPVRAQETLLRWRFDGYSGIQAMDQIDWHGGEHIIPLQKSLLFRTQQTRNNPEGRALALDTPIPTPDGWRTMADLQVGSKVFDEKGNVRYVTAVADWNARPCYRLTFADGTSIIADENHQWVTRRTRNPGPNPIRVCTTAEIAAQTNGEALHAVEWAASLDYSEQHLAIDPYLLGLWLGDGHKRAARITCHADDVEEQAVLVEACGYNTITRPNGRIESKGRVLDVRSATKWRHSPQAALRAMHVLENKHVPEHYLRGSKEQRLALLQGLMDSDGYVDHLGRCEFINTNRRLVDAVAELVRSLGCGVRVSLKRAAGTVGGRDHIVLRHDAYAVKFTPAFVPFRLRRKAERVEAHFGQRRYRRSHFIVRAERVENRRTRCIEVDSPSHLFLAGEAMVPTHNSILRNAYTSYFALKNVKALEGIGIERDLAGIPVISPPEGVDLFAAGQASLLQKVQTMVTSIRRDEYEGVVLPTAGWTLELLNTGGSRQFDTDKVVRRYRADVALSMLADFVLIGQDNVGSYAMVDVKSDLFGVALDGILDLICEVFNQHAIPRLLRLNGMDLSDPPQLAHSSARKVDLERTGAFLQAIALAGAPIPWSIQLFKALFTEAGLPADFQDADPAKDLPGQEENMNAQNDIQGERAEAEQDRSRGSTITKAGIPPHLRLTNSETVNCRTCVYMGDDGMCDKYTYPVKTDNVCDSWAAPMHKADTQDGKVVHVGPLLQHRSDLLSMNLEAEIRGALAQLGEQAATAYMSVATKASKPSLSALHRLAGRVLRAVNIQGWVQDRLMPILKNHAARVSYDTQRVLQTELNLEVSIADREAQKIAKSAGENLHMRDIEPQVRLSILNAIRQGLEAGDNPTKTAQRIRDQVPQGRFVHAGPKYRAQLIAVNETQNLQRAATLAVYKSNPNITAVQLQDGIYGPPRSDGECIARDGQIVPIDQAEETHPFHPRCTLSYLPVVSYSAP